MVANSSGDILSRLAIDKAHATDQLKFVPVACYQIPVEEIEGTGIFAGSHGAIESAPPTIIAHFIEKNLKTL
jgi:hypothetical protein